MREITFDLETTGLDPRSGHKIVEIGCVELIDKRVTGNSFHAYVNPQRDVPKAAEKVHGLSTEFLSNKPIFDDVVDEFLEFVKFDKLVIHNAAFDMGFINYQLKELSKPMFFNEQAIDTLQMARKKYPGAKASLDALCGRFDISLEQRKEEKHGALLDAQLLAEVYIHLTGGYQNSLNLGSTKAHTQQTVEHDASAPGKHHQPRHFPPTSEEIAAHTEFMRKISS